MDLTPVLLQVLKSIWWVIPIAILIAYLKSPKFKGAAGEFAVKHIAKLRLPTDTYHPIHNVTLPTPDGTTQIDHINVSRYGVFVIETKNMKGWIFGNERQSHWTQQIYRKKTRFQNPLRQNFKHTKAIEALLDIPPKSVRSVIVFTGDCKFKTELPQNVTKAGGFADHILAHTDPVFTDDEVRAMVTKIEDTRFAATRDTNRKHVAQLKSRSDTQANQICPKCGRKMLLRTARRGKDQGKMFWGCSSYPNCRFTRDVG